MTTDAMTTRQNGQAIEKKKQAATLWDVLRSREAEIAKLAGNTLSPERLTRLAIQAYNASPCLQRCSASSIIKALLDAARMGLEPDGEHGALVPMNTKNGWEAQFWPMYKGLCARAYDDPSVQTISARVVREGEHFIIHLGTRDEIEHTPDAACADNAPIAYYSIIKMRGTVKFEVMWASEIEKIHKRSPSARSGAFSPWTSDTEEMGKKTVLKRNIKTAPLRSPRLSEATAVDAENEGVQVIDAESPPPPEKPRKQTRADEMKARLSPPETPPVPDMTDDDRHEAELIAKEREAAGEDR